MGLTSDALGAAIDAMPEPFTVLQAVRDAEGTIVDFVYLFTNRAARELNGLPSGVDLLGRRVLDLHRGLRDAGLIDHYARVVETGEPLALNLFHYDETGRGDPLRGTFDITASKVGDGIACTWRDMTQIEQTQERDRLQARLLDEVDAAVIATDPQDRVTYWSRGAERLYGWSAEEALGKPVTDILAHWNIDQDVIELEQRARAESTQFEAEVTHKDGSRIQILSRSVLIKDGEQVTGLLGVSVDIRAIKAAETQLREATSFLSAVTDSMAEGIFVIDPEGKLTFMNEAAEALLAWSSEELVGQFMHDKVHFDRRDGSPHPAELCPILQVARGGPTVHVDHDVFVRRDGTHLAVEYTSSPLRPDGVAGAVVVFGDITERAAEQVRVQRELDKLAWVGRIRDALDQGRFVLYAQPIMDLRTEVIVQYELLIRMVTQDKNVILPSRFLPTAEEFGLIGEIDRWVINEAVQLAAAGHRVEFNLSAQSVGDPNMLHTIRDALADAGAGAENLVCEITETSLIRDASTAETFVRSVTALGCQVALDDFGVGYGGFSQLKQLPVSYVKIDSQFVTDLITDESNQHVVRAIVSLAHGFGLKTIAEGAEDIGTLNMLKELDVDFVQGYVIARPAPIETFFKKKRRK